MWPISMWQLAVCGGVTLLALLLGFIYTYIRQKGVKSLSAVFRATEEHCAKWPSDRTKLERQDDDHGSVRSDPVKFCSHIPGHIKQTKHRITQQKIEATMTQEERNQEREIQRRQLEEIFRVMEEQKEKFGVKDVADVQEQLKMYIQ